MTNEILQWIAILLGIAFGIFNICLHKANLAIWKAIEKDNPELFNGVKNDLPKV